MPECLYISIHPKNPNPRDIDRAVAVLQRGGVVIYPTDTVYGIGCDITNVKAVEQVIKLKGLKPKDAHFSFICKDLSNIADFAKVSNSTFKLMKKNLPGPFTFVLPGLHRVPYYFLSKRKTVGIRIPNHQIPLELVNRLGNPILTTSLKDSDEVIEYTTDPELIYENYKHLVDAVIDGGVCGNIPSTIVDCSGDEPIILREGLGELVL